MNVAKPVGMLAAGTLIAGVITFGIHAGGAHSVPQAGTTSRISTPLDENPAPDGALW